MQLREILNAYRESSENEREKGDYFERLVRVYFENDNTQKQYFSKVEPFGEWAKTHGWKSNDTGIDLVATMADGSGFAAIQCKFYEPYSNILKKHIDSFISASANDLFTRLIIVDTTLKDFSSNLVQTLDKLSKDWNRISLSDLEASPIDWEQFLRTGAVNLAAKKELRPHQSEALKDVSEGLAKADRGKMIMACGTGKTFTALRIAEKLAGKGKLVLFMVPSLALMSQTVREWKSDCQEDFTAFSACSDSKIGISKDADSLDLNVHDLAFPATTDAAKLAEQVKNAPSDRMTVVFSTYHSIDVLSRAQHDHGMPEFDLVICDEAHRTTGVTLSGEDESNFVRIHSNDNVAAKKRLYMTATPRIYGEAAKNRADNYDARLASMDDEAMFGKTLFHCGFGWAVEHNLLSDYKVIVLAVDSGLVSKSIQNRLKDGPELTLDDATKIIGCYKALTKSDLAKDLTADPQPMHRALAFCQTIATSRMVEDEFSKVVDEYLDNQDGDEDDYLHTDIRHVDGSFNASAREELLNWLREDAGDKTCRILTNARVLSEGVDVPALDAIMFMHPRKSQIDVVQSVGRVMRTAPGKKLGYVILPVAIPPDTSPEESLNENERYQVVWQILNALRAHDERLDARINQAKLGEDIRDAVEIVRISSQEELDNLTAVVQDINTTKTKALKRTPDIGGGNGWDDNTRSAPLPPEQLEFTMDEFTRAIMAKIVEKCGTRDYWDKWASDIADIAQAHITRIKTIIENPGPERTAFDAFLEELRDDLNPEISEGDAVEMLAQHLITRPVFDALFRDRHFMEENPVSKAMETVLQQLHEHNLAKESQSLEKFYASVERRAKDVKTAAGRQTLITELYDRFFRTAFKSMTERLGIVYTPVEVVDFIIHSVNDVLKVQFGETLGSKGVHILDPFTGTGTFITRLLQSGLIAPEEMAHKYKYEIHANEIVLLAYYIATVNIETVFHEQMAGTLNADAPYEPFPGILLTDTFQMYEQDHDMIANLLPDNSKRREAQKKLDIRVIIGNPPYSAGQKSANDNAANIAYPHLDASIHESYAEKSTSSNLQNLYDSYIRAIRWASERIGDAGVIGFVSGSAWVERSFADGMRKCLAEEFSDLYIFHLRGDIRKNILSHGTAREGQNIFRSGSMTGISISVLVKNPKKTKFGQIHFCDIGLDLTTDQKLSLIRQYASINGINKKIGWKEIKPDKKNDWLDQVDSSFENYLEIGNKKDKTKQICFSTYSLGIASSRDAWVYNSSLVSLKENIKRSILFYNKQLDVISNNKNNKLKDSINYDAKKISWNDGLIDDLKNKKIADVNEGVFVQSEFRPFSKYWFYYSKMFNQRRYKIPIIFPQECNNNYVIQISGVGARSGFSVLMLNTIPNLHTVDSGQCFPLYIYEESKPTEGLFAGSDADKPQLTRRDAITDEGLAHFQAAYPGEEISKEDLFCYIYGILHSPEYRERFKNNLAKQLPRIPAVKKFVDFAAFRDAGRRLGDLHVNFETVEPYMVTYKEGSHDLYPEAQENPQKFYRIKKMKFGGKGKEKDKTTVIYNDFITMQNIPLAAYDYVVNGKPALEWVMERQCVKTDKASGIVNDANDYANETMHDPAYPLKLFQRVITVSLETMKIVNALPALDID